MNQNGSNERYEAPWNFSWVISKVLAGSSCPQTLENLKFLKQQGISHLVTLSSDYKPASINFPGITNTAIYIEEFEAPTLEDIKRFIGLCVLAKENDEAIAVHCRAGRGRTGTMIACYFVYFLDMSPDTAITRIRLMRPGSVETYAQERAVSMYRDYLRTLK